MPSGFGMELPLGLLAPIHLLLLLLTIALAIFPWGLRGRLIAMAITVAIALLISLAPLLDLLFAYAPDGASFVGLSPSFYIFISAAYVLPTALATGSLALLARRPRPVTAGRRAGVAAACYIIGLVLSAPISINQVLPSTVRTYLLGE